VNGYQIGYGGWAMAGSSFHDNVITQDGASLETSGYGFNIDSDPNAAVTIKNNQIIHPATYGIVVGAGIPSGAPGPASQMKTFQIVTNTIDLQSNNSLGIKLQGNVTDTLIGNNNIVIDSAGAPGISAIQWTNTGNAANVYQNNRLNGTLSYTAGTSSSGDCIYGNVGGTPPLANTQNVPCAAPAAVLSDPFFSVVFKHKRRQSPTRVGFGTRNSRQSGQIPSHSGLSWLLSALMRNSSRELETRPETH
jgi:hypothetical protein